MALNGTPREETDQYLAENFELSDRAALLDEVYASVGADAAAARSRPPARRRAAGFPAEGDEPRRGERLFGQLDWFT